MKPEEGSGKEKTRKMERERRNGKGAEDTEKK
jgi:hypothetical protein